MAEVILKYSEIEVSIRDDGLTSNECIDKAINTILDLSVQMENSKGDTAKSCIYGGKEYSPGSVVDMPNPNDPGEKKPKTCQENGTFK